MGTVLTIIHVLNCVLLIVVVLLQSSKGGGLAGAFGGGQTSSAVFGGRGAGTFLSKLTTALAVVFMLTSLTLTVIGRRTVESESVLRRAIEQEGQTAVPQAGLPRQAAPVEQEEPDEAAPEAPPAQPGTGR
ncbi:MAG: preprotein translocase subunit SecG [Candidatus Eisenbacteria bacterium]